MSHAGSQLLRLHQLGAITDQFAQQLALEPTAPLFYQPVTRRVFAAQRRALQWLEFAGEVRLRCVFPVWLIVLLGWSCWRWLFGTRFLLAFRRRLQPQDRPGWPDQERSCSRCSRGVAGRRFSEDDRPQ